MDLLNSTITEHKKGEHLSFEERVIIQTRLKDAWSLNAIAKELGRPRSTIFNEVKRGMVHLYNGKVTRYKATAGQAVYERNREVCCRKYDLLKKSKFIEYVSKHVHEDKWSLDACVGRALADNSFTRNEVTCTKTLYNYVDNGLMDIRNIDLPDKLRRAPKDSTPRENKRVLGRSIEERPPEVDTRQEFGHWECDLVIGAKAKDDDAILTMIERKTREFWLIRIPGKDPQGVMNALKSVRSEYSERWDQIFKSITTDNGSEFSTLSSLESISKTRVYFAHPYTSCEKGSIERHNGLIRRFIPKGSRIDSFTDEQLSVVEQWCNNLPRRILWYKTPDELFEAEVDAIYTVAA